jgi:serine/threonine protein kinase/Tfp pilus assembly protein PilF
MQNTVDEEAIFQLARKLDSRELREVYLQQVCGDDEPLMARVKALLEVHEQGQDFLSHPAAVVAEAGQPMRSWVGAVIGPYKLVEQIGEGGFGLVFMAEQQYPLRRKVAIKILKPGMDTRQVIARFEAERQALALMDHPNIAKVLDAGTTPSGHPHFVMELVHGLPITAYCDQNCLTTRQRLELFACVCQAVQHAHHKGIIHRDIKPTNVMVTLHDGAPVVKVIDFGIAKALGQELTDKTLCTGFAQFVGTPLYMSPEQAQLGSLDIDTRCDIYSLGVLLYELLTGTTPFDQERLDEAGYDELRRIIREEEPPRPSARLSTLGQAAMTVSQRRQSDPKRLGQLLRGELDWIVTKALEKDRTRRYESAGAFAADIQRYLHDEPVTACPPSTWYRLRKSARRHKTALVSAAAAVLVLLFAAAGIGLALWDQAKRQTELSQRRAETERTVSLALDRADQLAARAEKMPVATSADASAGVLVWQQANVVVDQAEAALTDAADENLRQRVTAMRSKVEVGRRIADKAQGQARRKEQLFRDLDEARMARSEWIDLRGDNAGAAAKYAAAFAAFDLDLAGGTTDELARRIDAAEPDVRDALIVALDDWIDAAARKPDPRLAATLLTLAQSADKDLWRQSYRAAVDARDRKALTELSAEARRSALPPSSLILLARNLDFLGEHREALELLRFGRGLHPSDFWVHFELGCRLEVHKGGTPLEIEEAIGCYRAALVLRPAASAVRSNLGNALYAKKQLDEAMAEFHKAIKLDPKNVVARNNLGVILADRGQLDDAIVQFREAIKLFPKYALAYNGLGLAYYAKKQTKEAILQYRKAIEIDSRLAAAHHNLGVALDDMKRPGEAEAQLRKAIEINPRSVQSHLALGNLLMAENQLDEAATAFRKATELDPKHLVAHASLGEVLRAKKQWNEACAAYRKVIEIDPQYAPAHHCLGMALRATNQLDEAIIEFRKAMAIDPTLPQTHGALGEALLMNGQFQEARAATQRALDMISEKQPARPFVLRQRQQCDRLLALEAKLNDVLAGNASPADNRERLGLIEVCVLKRLYLTAARLSTEAFSMDARVADDLKAFHRYNAACAAALAAAGQGADREKIDDMERVKLRKQALAWLRADLDLWSKRLMEGRAEDRDATRSALEHWQQDPDLAGLRDAAGLNNLPPAEAAAWRKLWADVADTLSRLMDKTS